MKRERWLYALAGLVAVVGLLFSARVQAAEQAGTSEIEIYTLKSNASVKVGYPKGWTVAENQAGVIIAEKATADSAGVIILAGQLQGNLKTREDLAAAMVGALRQSYPDLKVTSQQPHPQAADILTMDATLSSGGQPFQALMWCVAQKGVGLFAAFYAPKERYGSFNAQAVLIACVGPMLGGAQQPAAAPAPAAGLQAGTVPDAKGGEIIFIRQTDAGRVLCSLDPATGKVTPGYGMKGAKAIQPTRARGKDTICLTILNSPQPCLGTGSGVQFKSNVLVNLPAGQGSFVTHPSISRDGKIVAVRIEAMQHTGNVNVVDTTGRYDHTFVAVNSSIKIAGYDAATGAQKVVWLDQPWSGVTGVHPWNPTFSPTQDVLAYAEKEKICLCDAASGKLLREFKTPQGLAVMDASGLAFSPDGAKVAYLSCTTYNTAQTSGNIVYAVVLVDVRSGASQQALLSKTVRPYSLGTGSPTSAVCLDFSPDGRYLVFSGTPKEENEWWGYARLDELQPGYEHPCDIYVLDLTGGACRRLTTDGKSFDPVWNGR